MKNKLLKSVCALLLAAIVFCTGLCLQVFAQPSESLYEYSVYDGGITITKYNGNDTELVIPQEIDGYPVQYLNANWLPENVAENERQGTVLCPEKISKDTEPSPVLK